MKLRVLLTIFAAAFTTGALTPHEKVVRLLNDKYFRSPTVVLMESTELSLTRTGIVWSRVAQLIPENKDYHILVASFNSTDLARPVEARSAWDVQESARFMTAKIRKFKKSEAPASEVTEDFGAMQALERIATSNWLPYDGCLMLFTALYPSDSDNATRAIQALILRRTKLFVVWLESEKETPEVYRMVAQQTGGELLETNWTPDLNQTAEYEADDTEIFDGRQKEQQKQLITPPAESVQREVLIAVRQGARGKSVMSLPVDSSIDEMEVKITGRLDSAFLRKPSGEPLALVNASDGQRIRTEGEQGRWRLDASGTLYDVAVQATSRLAYDVITPPTPTNTNISQGVSFKLKKLRGEGKLEKVTLVDETGKSLADLENLSGIRRGDTEERRLRFPTPEEEQEAEKEEPGEERNEDAAGDTEWLIPVDKLPSKQYFVQVDGRNAKGEPFRRLSALSVRGGEGWSVPPVMVEVSERSQLSARPGQTVQLYFDVVSFHFRPLPMVFYAHDDRSFIRYINPTRITVYPQTKIQVAVLLEVQAINQDKDTIALTAESIVGPVTGKAYLYANNQRSEDTAKPDISITTDGYCRDYLSPQVCYSKFWRVDANIRDSNGLLRIRSVPLGLEYKNEFIAGTMEEVRVHYQSTCCNTRVDIIAIDIYGNINAKTVDIEKVWLTAGEIAAIVFGSVLALLLLLLIIIAIIFCIRRRRSHNFVMHR